jgi:hypothetical protein
MPKLQSNYMSCEDYAELEIGLATFIWVKSTFEDWRNKFSVHEVFLVFA